MNHVYKKPQLILVLTTVIASSFSSIGLTAMKTSQDLLKGGVRQTNDSSSGGNQETCVIPNKYSFGLDAKYSKSDSEMEKELCSIDFDSNPLCPKLNSTNPGTLVVDKEKFDSKNTLNCSKKDFSVQAKFKQSITCSYSSSALAAYHLTRILNINLNTPVSVVKTMKSDHHKQIVDQAKSILSNRTNEIIYKSWKNFDENHVTKNRSEEKLFVDKGQFLYGALSENVKKENIYTEVSGVGPYDTRYERFKTQTPFVRVSNSDNLSAMFASELNKPETLAPKIKQMEDVTNMVILDTLLAQDDRIGNIHFYISWGHIKDGKLKLKKLSKDQLSDLQNLYNKSHSKLPKPPSRWTEADFTSLSKSLFELYKNKTDNPKHSLTPNGFLVREMVLKDNDCGVDVDKRSNNMRRISAIEGLRHISMSTYENVMRFYKFTQENSAAVKDFFMNTLLYRQNDYMTSRKSFMDNLTKVVTELKKNCESGALKRDLNYAFDSDNQWANQDPGKDSCEVSLN